MGAYRNFPNIISPSDETISFVDAKSFNLYQEMIAAEKELEEKTLLDLLNEVEEEVYETKISEGVFAHNINKLSGDDTRT